jgi:hypothetical protein
MNVNPGQVVKNGDAKFKVLCVFDSYFDGYLPEIHCRKFLNKKSKKNPEGMSKRIYVLREYTPQECG